MNFQQVPIWQIQRDPSNVRQEINQNNVESMKHALWNGRQLPLINVRVINGQYLCTDGMHRLTAYRELGYTKLYVNLVNQDNVSAQQASFWQNEGMNNSELDRAHFFLQQYQQGIAVSKLCNTKIKADKVRQYIRWGYWLIPEAIKQERTVVPDKVKNVLMEYEKSFQRDLLNYFLANRTPKERLNTHWIQNQAVESGITAASKNMRDIPITLNKNVDAIAVTKDPLDEYLTSVYQQLCIVSQESGRSLHNLFITLYNKQYS